MSFKVSFTSARECPLDGWDGCAGSSREAVLEAFARTVVISKRATQARRAMQSVSMDTPTHVTQILWLTKAKARTSESLCLHAWNHMSQVTSCQHA